MLKEIIIYSKYIMNKLDFEVQSTRNFLGMKEQTYKITRKDKQMNIRPKDIINLVNEIESQAKKKGETIRVMIRGLNGVRMFTLKGYDTELNVLDEEEYFDSKVRDATKFSDFSQLQVSIMKETK
jgi:hypothetical protein